jgi:hypothetical protein
MDRSVHGIADGDSIDLSVTISETYTTLSLSKKKDEQPAVPK